MMSTTMDTRLIDGILGEESPHRDWVDPRTLCGGLDQARSQASITSAMTKPPQKLYAEHGAHNMPMPNTREQVVSGGSVEM
jgi:hypothetical protein